MAASYEKSNNMYVPNCTYLIENPHLQALTSIDLMGSWIWHRDSLRHFSMQAVSILKFTPVTEEPLMLLWDSLLCHESIIQSSRKLAILCNIHPLEPVRLWLHETQSLAAIGPTAVGINWSEECGRERFLQSKTNFWSLEWKRDLTLPSSETRSSKYISFIPNFLENFVQIHPRQDSLLRPVNSCLGGWSCRAHLHVFEKLSKSLNLL